VVPSQGRGVHDDLEPLRPGGVGPAAAAILRANVKRGVFGHLAARDGAEFLFGIGAEKDVVVVQIGMARGTGGKGPDLRRQAARADAAGGHGADGGPAEQPARNRRRIACMDHCRRRDPLPAL
jgi:hypothetical protein